MEVILFAVGSALISYLGLSYFETLEVRRFSSLKDKTVEFRVEISDNTDPSIVL